ncbi:MAG: hypothetical protein Kow00127_01870 [Bacteroidales bacterium]
MPAISTDPGPESLTTASAPVPGGVAGAHMVSCENGLEDMMLIFVMNKISKIPITATKIYIFAPVIKIAL